MIHTRVVLLDTDNRAVKLLHLHDLASLRLGCSKSSALPPSSGISKSMTTLSGGSR